MFKTSSSISSGSSAVEATTEAINDAKAKIGDLSVIGAVIFASSSFDQKEVLETAAAVLGADVQITGASTAGEISQSGPSNSPSVSLMLFASDSVTCQAAIVTEVSGSEDEKGVELAKSLQGKSGDAEIMLITMFGDGLKVNPNGILRGIESVLPDVPIAGGSAGDDGKYKQTYQYCNGEVHSNGVAAMSFSGPLNVSIGVRHGWTPISGSRTVTKSDGAVVHEIDNKPAIALYEEFIGEQAEKLKGVTLAEIALSYPLGLIDEKSKEMLLRAPFYVDESGSITFGGEVPEGSLVQLMMGTKEQAVEAAREAGKEAVDQLGTKPQAAIIFSCHVRDTLYKSREEAKAEIDAIQEATGSDVPLVGFYTYAEQAPVNTTNLNLKTCDTVNHNETIVTVLLAEQIS